MVEELALEDDLVLLCGHYEGIDDRVLQEVVTDYISIGDYVLTGGELGAMVLVDAVSRFVPGVLSNEESSQFESLQDNLLRITQDRRHGTRKKFRRCFFPVTTKRSKRGVMRHPWCGQPSGGRTFWKMHSRFPAHAMKKRNRLPGRTIFWQA